MDVVEMLEAAIIRYGERVGKVSCAVYLSLQRHHLNIV